MTLDPRAQIIDEMLSLFLQNPSEKQIKGYLTHLKDVPTDQLKAAVAGCIEHGSHGKPHVADIRRRASELVTRRSSFNDTADVIPIHAECKKITHETKHGTLLCCREAGHAGDCEAWFKHGGPRPGDAEIIIKLGVPEGRVVPIRPAEELVDSVDDLIFGKDSYDDDIENETRNQGLADRE
jgi:hypothetical protein